jgi:hypothetical protein
VVRHAAGPWQHPNFVPVFDGRRPTEPATYAALTGDNFLGGEFAFQAAPGPIPGSGLLSYIALGLLGLGSMAWKGYAQPDFAERHHCGSSTKVAALSVESETI